MLPLRPRGGHAVEHQVFFADPRVSDEAVLSVAIEAAGLANNVNYSEAAIMASIARLDEVGVAHTGAGANRALARAPAILKRDGVRFGFVQHSSVYWPKILSVGAHARNS
jgi:poly-gamma-glutamate synthesis protein (capsule biosynthesis protein)